MKVKSAKKECKKIEKDINKLIKEYCEKTRVKGTLSEEEQKTLIEKITRPLENMDVSNKKDLDAINEKYQQALFALERVIKKGKAGNYQFEKEDMKAFESMKQIALESKNTTIDKDLEMYEMAINKTDSGEIFLDYLDSEIEKVQKDIDHLVEHDLNDYTKAIEAVKEEDEKLLKDSQEEKEKLEKESKSFGLVYKQLSPMIGKYENYEKNLKAINTLSNKIQTSINNINKNDISKSKKAELETKLEEQISELMELMAAMDESYDIDSYKRQESENSQDYFSRFKDTIRPQIKEDKEDIDREYKAQLLKIMNNKVIGGKFQIYDSKESKITEISMNDRYFDGKVKDSIDDKQLKAFNSKFIEDSKKTASYITKRAQDLPQEFDEKKNAINEKRNALNTTYSTSLQAKLRLDEKIGKLQREKESITKSVESYKEEKEKKQQRRNETAKKNQSNLPAVRRQGRLASFWKEIKSFISVGPPETDTQKDAKLNQKDILDALSTNRKWRQEQGVSDLKEEQKNLEGILFNRMNEKRKQKEEKREAKKGEER